MAAEAEAQALKPFTPITSCRVCKGTKLTWDTCNRSNSGVQDGRLRLNEVQCYFFLGCDNCSETLTIVSADKVAGYLTTVLDAAIATSAT